MKTIFDGVLIMLGTISSAQIAAFDLVSKNFTMGAMGVGLGAGAKS